MHVWSSAATTAEGTPEAFTIVVQISRSALRRRRELPETAKAQRWSRAFVSAGVSVAGAALAIVARQVASVWARLGVIAGGAVAVAVEDEFVVVVDVDVVEWEPRPRWRGLWRPLLTVVVVVVPAVVRVPVAVAVIDDSAGVVVVALAG